MATYIMGMIDWFFYYLIIQYLALGAVVVYKIYTAKFKIANVAVFWVPASRRADDMVTGSYTFDDSYFFKNKGVLDEDGSYCVVLPQGTDLGGKIAGMVDEKGKPLSVQDVFAVIRDERVGGGAYVWAGEMEFNGRAHDIHYGKGTFHVDLGFPSRRRNGYTYYDYNFLSGSHLNFGGEVESYNPRTAQRHLRAGVVEKFLMGGNPISMMMVAIMVIIAVVAIIAGLFGGMQISAQPNFDKGFQLGNSTAWQSFNATLSQRLAGGFP